MRRERELSSLLIIWLSHDRHLHVCSPKVGDGGCYVALLLESPVELF